MTDKEKIKAEIENRMKKYEKILVDEYNNLTHDGVVTYKTKQFECNDILRFIDSLPEEPVNEDLEEAAEKYAYELFPSVGVANTETELAFKAGAQ